MNVICFNGQFLSGKNIKANNGCFETIFYNKGFAPLLQRHAERLFSSLTKLNIAWPLFFNEDFIAKAINKLCNKNGLTTARIRLSIFPNNDEFNYLIESFITSDDLSRFNEAGYKLTIYTNEVLLFNDASNIKKTERNIYNNALGYAKAGDFNDAIILNDHKNIVETSIANIFFVKNDMLYTPALKEGCIAGIMRAYVLEIAKELNLVYQEKQISIADISGADEVFITNALRGVRWVNKLGNSVFTQNKLALTLHEKIKQKLKL